MAAAAAAALALVAAGCGSGDAESGERGRGDGGPAGATEGSSPFQVGHGPAGYRLVQAGRGTIEQTWSSDSVGTDEPVTVLAPGGEGPGRAGEMLVSATGFAGYEGGLAQASRSYGSDESEELELDGRRAIYMPRHAEGDRSEPADLVVEVGEDLAARVSSADATRDELVEVARRVRLPDDRLLAPQVPDPPAGLEVVGWADADVAVSLTGAPLSSSDSLPAGERAHTTVWARGEEPGPWSPDGTVVVTTLPGSALDLDALEASLHRLPFEPTVTQTAVDGRPGAVLELATSGPAGAVRAVVSSTPDGDLLLVVARGADPPAVDELLGVAASVERASPQQWEELVLAASDGPGLHADEGAVELERGTAGGVEWLFQARVDDSTVYDSFSTGDEDTTGQFVADPCLMLSTGERVCTEGASSTAGGVVLIEHHEEHDDWADEPDFPGFVIVTTTTADARTVRLRTGDGSTLDVRLHLLPGGQRRAGIVVGDMDVGALLPRCDDPGGQAEPGTFALLDEAGRRLRCAPPSG